MQPAHPALRTRAGAVRFQPGQTLKLVGGSGARYPLKTTERRAGARAGAKGGGNRSVRRLSVDLSGLEPMTPWLRSVSDRLTPPPTRSLRKRCATPGATRRHVLESLCIPGLEKHRHGTCRPAPTCHEIARRQRDRHRAQPLFVSPQEQRPDEEQGRDGTWDTMSTSRVGLSVGCIHARTELSSSKR